MQIFSTRSPYVRIGGDGEEKGQEGKCLLGATIYQKKKTDKCLGLHKYLKFCKWFKFVP